MNAKSCKLRSFLFLLPALLLMIIFALLTAKAVNTFALSKSEEMTTCVVIDPGHGGVDGGAVSCTGVYESQINLQISLRLNDLMQLLGYRTKIIRTEDISVYTKGNTISEKKISDLKERVRIINSTQNALLISIHQNFFQDSRYNGAQVFYAKSGYEFAKIVQSQFCKTINSGSNRRIKKADGIYLMEKINGPGILIECGFLSNPSEEYNLRDAGYQKKLCCVIASATSQYINHKAIA